MKAATVSTLPWALVVLFISLGLLLVNQNPVEVWRVLFESAFSSGDSFSYVLFYATPLLFTGTAVALTLEAGLFNIGAEGQLYMGALGAAIVSALSSTWSSPDAGIFSLLFWNLLGVAGAVSLGAFWGASAGWLKSFGKVHEVIATILLNFVAYAIVNWAILYPLKNTETQNPETVPLLASLTIPKAWGHTTLGLFLGLFVAGVALWAIRQTWWGYRVRAVGKNPHAAQTAGMSVAKTSLVVFAVAGGVAGLVGYVEVFLNSQKLVDSFSPGFGFTGLAVALLARGRLIPMIFACVLFGALQKGALDLDIETERVTRDLSLVIQASILLALSIQSAIKKG